MAVGRFRETWLGIVGFATLFITASGCNDDPLANGDCTPRTCASVAKSCGPIDDGCGGTIDCGACTLPETCGGGGTASVCGVGACVPVTCEGKRRECGELPDGCGQLLDCGTCTAPESCGGGGIEGRCGCNPETDAELCAASNAECGVITTPDRCGRTREVDCGDPCVAPESCGGGIDAHQCGCTATLSDASICMQLRKSCGSFVTRDSCGESRTVTCLGSCTLPETCGGGGTANVCGCPAESDAALCALADVECGALTTTDSCGATRNVDCGDTCVAPESCGGGLEAYACGCTPRSDAQICSDLGKTCGSFQTNDNCGNSRTISCTGTCSLPATCGGGTVANVCGCTGEMDVTLCTLADAECGTIHVTDSCNVTKDVDCGNPCVGYETCGGGVEAHKCDCTPRTDAQICTTLGKTCGSFSTTDNCGESRTITCTGTCTLPQTCGGGTVANVCGCTGEMDVTLCTLADAECGTIHVTDSCNVTKDVNCGDPCLAPETCGGVVTSPNECGCTPRTDAQLCSDQGKTCGSFATTDNCNQSRTVTCTGTCTLPQTCGGGDVSNVCGCTGEADDELCLLAGAECGTIHVTDSCDVTMDVNCGNPCVAPETCGGVAASPNECGCTSQSKDAFCVAQNAECGSVTANDNCGSARTEDCGTCADPADCGRITPHQCDPGQIRLRIMAANISSGTQQAYELPGIHIFQAIKPDIVLIQEFNYKLSPGTIESFISRAFGAGYEAFREAGSSIPNGIISRYPILESGQWHDTIVSNRDIVWARIDIPGPVDLWAVSVHLYNGGTATDRDNEAKIVVANLQQKLAQVNGYVVVGGDFNMRSRTEAGIGTLRAVVKAEAPWPADQRANTNPYNSMYSDTSAGRDDPYDWVLVDTTLDSYEVPCVLGTVSHPNGMVFDSRVFSPLFPDADPVVYGDSAASGMQHMAVVRDFVLP